MKPRSRKVVVRQAGLEQKLEELDLQGCRITDLKVVMSRRRRHGIVKCRVVTVITFLDPRPLWKKPPPFYEASGRRFGSVKR
jgi:hypothetical protein